MKKFNEYIKEATLGGEKLKGKANPNNKNSKKDSSDLNKKFTDSYNSVADKSGHDKKRTLQKGKAAWDVAHAKKQVSEESLQELKDSTLRSYVRKATKDGKEATRQAAFSDYESKHGDHSNKKKGEFKDEAEWLKGIARKRASGVDKAHKKLIKFDEESLQEISKRTLQSYRDKARNDAKETINASLKSKSDSEVDSSTKKLGKRLKGVLKATKKLQKEEMEISESKSKEIIKKLTAKKLGKKGEVKDYEGVIDNDLRGTTVNVKAKSEKEAKKKVGELASFKDQNYRKKRTWPHSVSEVPKYRDIRDTYKKHDLKEEPLQETSPEKVKTYLKKAYDGLAHAQASGDSSTTKKRLSGIRKGTKKMMDNAKADEFMANRQKQYDSPGHDGKSSKDGVRYTGD